MNHRGWMYGGITLAALVASCGGNGATPAGGVGSGGTGAAADALPCDVDAVLAAHCRQCHGASTAFGAPMSLVTYGDLIAPSHTDPKKKTYEMVEARIHDDAHAMPPAPLARLGAGEASTLDAWVAAGAPAANALASSSAACSGGNAGGGGSGGSGGGSGGSGGTGGTGNADAGAGGAGPGPQPLDCTPDTFVKPSAPHTVGMVSDEYVCFGVDVNVTPKRHVIALSPDIDNTAVVHHLLLYKASQSVSSVPGPCGVGAQGELVMGWAPGVGNLVLPPEAGYPEEGTTHWVIQIHYNNEKGLQNQKDSTGFKLCTTEKLRPHDAGVLAFGAMNFSIPPRSTLNLSCNYTYGGPPIHAFTAQPHMHRTGRAMSTVNTSTAQTIVDYPNFDFNAQYIHPASFDIATGNVIKNTCVWANDTDKAITFGNKTADEMCFDFVAYYPQITTPGWSWASPSAGSTCTSQ